MTGERGFPWRTLQETAPPYGSFASGANVKVSGTSTLIVIWQNASRIKCVTRAGSAGAMDVTVTNPNGQFGTKTGGFTYN